MNMRWSLVGSIALLGVVLVAGEANAQTTVTYGRITAVRQVNIQNEGAQAAGTLVGGALGVASGSGQSRSNRALRGVGGAAVGNRLAGAAGSSTGFRYTVLLGGRNTIEITTEQAGLRVGDCVSVERGQFNNIRLVDDARCNAACEHAGTGERHGGSGRLRCRQGPAAECDDGRGLCPRRAPDAAAVR